jgi:sugar phosphate isomerase/epimerase
MKLSIVVSAQPAKFQAATFKGDLETNLQTVARLGYDGAELAIRNPTLIDLPDLDRMLMANHLRVPAIGTGQAWGEEGLSFTDPDEKVRTKAIQRIQSHIPIAAHFSAVIIIGLVRGIVKPGVELNQAKSWLVEALRTCSQAARPAGVRLALEPINRYETSLVNNTMEGLDLIECVGEENFGLLLDTFHMNIEEPSIEESIRNCGDRIFHFHVADSNRWYPGAGHLNFPSILAALGESDYQGFISGEFLPLPDASIAAQKGIAFLRSQSKKFH